MNRGRREKAMTIGVRAAAAALLGISAAAFLWAPTATPQAAAGREQAHNVRLVGFHDLAARTAYQPTIKQQGNRWIAYVGSHGGRMVNPLNGQLEENGTSILDVTDPRSPKLLFHIPGEKGRAVPGRETGGAQMTRVCPGSELPKADKKKTYLLRTFGDSSEEVWDVTAPERPALLAQFGKFRSTHKNEWECKSG